jgi:hypothetical protein
VGFSYSREFLLAFEFARFSGGFKLFVLRGKNPFFVTPGQVIQCGVAGDDRELRLRGSSSTLSAPRQEEFVSL